MEIRDPVHGSIHITDEEAPIIKGNFFQRLRNIKQLGFSEYVFPGATHTRFLHSIGVMHIGERVFDKLFSKRLSQNAEYQKLKSSFKLGCLLHDIGHAPLSHSTETVMPMVSELRLPALYRGPRERQATHEDYTIKTIVDSSFSQCFRKVEESFGVERLRIADLITGKNLDPQYFTIDGLNLFPILHQLISSELDCDRMDYLLRDSYFCGVSYGNYDLDWMIDNLEVCINQDNHVSLGITERSVVTFDDFLLSRYHMFIMVYFHYRPVCLEQLLYRYFATSPAEYLIPSDIEAYIEHDDYHLMKCLRASSNPYAQAIVQNKIPPKIFESFNSKQLAALQQLETFLSQEGIEFIRCSSQGRLSKYYQSGDNIQKYPMKVVRRNHHGKIAFSDIDEATDLFKKFSQSHSINRLHSELKGITPSQRKRIDVICDGSVEHE